MKKKKNKNKKNSKGNPKQESITDPQSFPIAEFEQDEFFKLAPDLVCILTSDGYLKKLNASWECTLGFTKKELLASPIVVFIHPDDIEDTFRELEKRTALHSVINFNNRFRCKDGSYKWLQWRANVPKDGKEILAVVREITDWKNTIELLEGNEKEYRTLFDHAPLECQTLDTEGNIIQVNQLWIETFGYSKEEITGKWFGDFLAPDSTRTFREQFLLLKTNGRVHCEFEMIRKDNTHVWVAFDGSIVYDSAKEIKFANCILQDITEDKNVQKSLFASEEKLKALIESTNDALLILDSSGKSIYSNSKFAGMWGIPTDKLGLGDEENLLSFLVNRLQELKQIHNKVKDLSKSALADIDFVEFKDGRIFELRSHPWILDNQIIGRVLYLRDHTEKIKMENAIKESEERFRFLAEYSPNLIFISTDWKIAYANKQWEILTGYTREELYGPGFDYLKLTAPEHRGLLKEKFQLMMAGHPVNPFEYVLISKNGNKVDTLLSPKLIRFGGENAIIGIITDITEQRKAEKVTRQKVESLESYHNLMVGRELKMIELKKEVNKLLLLLGEKEKYKIGS
jgi:PAS domain S-box-containing protein